LETNRICIIHPEGNINNNPNLTGIVEILCENGYEVDLYSLYRPELVQKNPCPGANLIIQKNSTAKDRINNYEYKLSKNYDMCIGVDEGIIEASFISQLADIPYGLLSYEIFFYDEIDPDNIKGELKIFKIMEIEACKNISFAIIQDETRASFLSRENEIPNDEFIYIPVSNRGTKKYKKMNFWHKEFGIPLEYNIALYMGTVDKWAMVEELLEITPILPKNWHIVIHSRSGFDNLGPKYQRILKNSENVHISKYSFETFLEMEEPLFSADAGLAFYNPVGGPQGGSNIKYIGLSSGKISTYLQHGLPVISNIGNPMSDYFEKYNIGIAIKNMEELKMVLSNWDSKKITGENCILFYKEYLDLDKTIVPLLTKINQLLNNNIIKKKFIKFLSTKSIVMPQKTNKFKRIYSYFGYWTAKKILKLTLILIVAIKKIKTMYKVKKKNF
jgi:O-antigen biosynthesis protein